MRLKSTRILAALTLGLFGVPPAVTVGEQPSTSPGSATQPHMTAKLPDYYLESFDDSVGLWKQKKGHTKAVQGFSEVHGGPGAADKLLAAGVEGRLDQIPTGRILGVLKSMQATEGPKRGCFRWYYEEPEVQDTNAAFFIGLPLITFRLAYGEKLSAADRATLDDMMANLRVWFGHEVDQPTFRYPNKFLGDLVCAWLLTEINGEVPRNLIPCMREAAKYWKTNNWGWGEHLSDGYSKVCLDELTILLTLGKNLPPDLRTEYEGLRDELLALGDAYAGGPRVPTIRSYAFLKPPEEKEWMNYREKVRAWNGKEDFFTGFAAMRAIAYSRGWHDAVPKPAPAATETDVPCFAGTHARAVIDGPIRLGAMSRYPIMKDIDHATWGLAWQSMPVAAWHSSGVWAFLQWESVENEVRRSHPASNRFIYDIGNILTGKADPGPIGQTFSIRKGSTFIILRRMPQMAPDWTELTDRVRIVGKGEFKQEIVGDANSSWHQLRLTLSPGQPTERQLRIGFVDLSGTRTPAVSTRPDVALDWSFAHTVSKQPSAAAPAVGLWVWSLGTGVDSAPMVHRNADQTFTVTVQDGNTQYVVHVDPTAEVPLTE
jgi:hypothetical protein